LNNNNKIDDTLQVKKLGRAVIHVRENSIDELEALFDPAKRCERSINKVPLIKRNLPTSFFQPPSILTRTSAGRFFHGRQTSLVDQLSPKPFQPHNQHQHHHHQSHNNKKVKNKLKNQITRNIEKSSHHSRSMSEPVEMSPMALSLSSAQNVFCFGSNNNLVNNTETVQLPFGWKSAKTDDGKTYYIKLVFNFSKKENLKFFKTKTTMELSI
jgi:hypothetical protein